MWQETVNIARQMSLQQQQQNWKFTSNYVGIFIVALKRDLNLGTLKDSFLFTFHIIIQKMYLNDFTETAKFQIMKITVAGFIGIIVLVTVLVSLRFFGCLIYFYLDRRQILVLRAWRAWKKSSRPSFDVQLTTCVHELSGV